MTQHTIYERLEYFVVIRAISSIADCGVISQGEGCLNKIEPEPEPGSQAVREESLHLLVVPRATLKPSHKGSPPQTVVRGGTCVNRRG